MDYFVFEVIDIILGWWFNYIDIIFFLDYVDMFDMVVYYIERRYVYDLEVKNLDIVYYYIVIGKIKRYRGGYNYMYIYFLIF